jgi:hypothetical protein
MPPCRAIHTLIPVAGDGAGRSWEIIDMLTNRRRTELSLALGVLAVALGAAPVAATAPERITWSDTYTVQHDCGVVEETTLTVSEKAFFAGGEWVRSVVHFNFDGVYTGPSGATYANETNQNAVFMPDRNQISGQGAFLRGSGGVLFHDTGILVFDPNDGSTFRASAKAQRFDDPGLAAALDAVLCSALG